MPRSLYPPHSRLRKSRGRWRAHRRWRRATGSRTRHARRLGISTTVAFCSVRATRGAEGWSGLCIILRRDDERRDAALGDVPDGTVDWRDIPDVAVGAHELEVGRIPVDRARKGWERALSREASTLPLALIGNPFTAGDAVEQSPLPRTPMPAGSRRGAAQVVAMVVASPRSRASMAAGTSAARCVPGDTVHCNEHAAADHHVHRLGNAGHVDPYGLRILLEVLYEPQERGADIAVALAAAGMQRRTRGTPHRSPLPRSSMPRRRQPKKAERSRRCRPSGCLPDASRM